MTAPTFNYTPHDSSPGSREVPRVRMSKMGDGYEQRSSAGLNDFDQFWELAFDNEELATVNAMKTFLRARRGVEPFYWTPPRESSPTLWIMEGEFKESNLMPNSSSFSVTFKRWYGVEE